VKHTRANFSLSSSSFRQAAATFTSESDRGTALIAVAWVDDALEACLRAFFRDKKNGGNGDRHRRIVDALLQPDGPLGSFASRIKLAYLLGIITVSLYSDLEIMRKIRNSFAHGRQTVRFSDQSIRDRCKWLAGAQAFQRGAGPIRSPRQKFLISAFFATEFLLSYAKHAKPVKTAIFDLYPSMIHRMAKSMSLKQLKVALEKLEN
jgi:DNA-binding MltR family transcriptional regulator